VRRKGLIATADAATATDPDTRGSSPRAPK
jgi:hypothetical protein